MLHKHTLTHAKCLRQWSVHSHTFVRANAPSCSACMYAMISAAPVSQPASVAYMYIHMYKGWHGIRNACRGARKKGENKNFYFTLYSPSLPVLTDHFRSTELFSLSFHLPTSVCWPGIVYFPDFFLLFSNAYFYFPRLKCL